MIYSLSFYDIDMYNYIVKIFKSNGIYTVRADDLGDKLRLTGFNYNKTILTQIYVDETYYNLDEGESIYLNLDFSIMPDILLEVNRCILPINKGFVVNEIEYEGHNKYNDYNKYEFDNLVDRATFKTNPIDQNMRKYIDRKIDKSLSKGKCKIRINTNKLKNVFNVLHYSDSVFFSVFNDRLTIDSGDFSFSLACDNKSDKNGSNIFKPSELYTCLKGLYSDRVTLRFDEKSPLFIKSKYKGMTIEHTISQLQKIDEEE